MHLRPLAILLLATAASAAHAQGTPAFTGGDVRQYWLDACARCHGTNGNGRDNAGNPLPDAGFDFTDSRKAGRRKDADWVRITKEGKEKMPPFGGKMTDAQIQRMVTEVLRPFGARR